MTAHLACAPASPPTLATPCGVAGPTVGGVGPGLPVATSAANDEPGATEVIRALDRWTDRFLERMARWAESSGHHRLGSRSRL